MKTFLLLFLTVFTCEMSFAQSQIITTGNNVINTTNPYAADIVIGSDANSGVRHDGSMMWWSNASASRISNSNDVFYFSVWNNTNSNIALSAIYGGASAMMGNLGIGTSNPLGGLHIATSANQWSAYNWGTNLLIQGNKNNAVGIFDSNGSNPWAVSNSAGSLMFAKMPDLGNTSTNPDIKFTINPSGFVGLGTNNPMSALSVINSSPVLQLFDSRGNPGDGSSFGKLAFGSIYGEFASIEGMRMSGDADDMTSIRFKTSYATGAGGDGDNMERMRIAYNGNVGIGTTKPDQKLTVNGTIHGSEVKVDTSIPVPDYVFQPSYKLKDLPALQNYLNKYHHLPEIPSAQQIQKNGLKLGQMNILLLKKVEELTLYLIDKDKQIQDQQSEIDQLKTQATLNRAQQEKIDKLEQKLNELSQAVNKNK